MVKQAIKSHKTMTIILKKDDKVKSIIDVLPDDYTFNDQCIKIIASVVLI